LSSDGKITIYAHNGFDEILALNGANGEITWKKKHPLPFRGGITSSKGFVFVSDFDGNLLSIDDKNGKTNWNNF
jgi:outer membrane protein assembly factor BamB